MATPELVTARRPERRVVGPRQANRVSPARLHEIVLAAFNGTGPCIEEAVHRALWGDAHPPAKWGDWPPHARATFDAAVALYNTLMRAMKEKNAAVECEVGRPAAPSAPEPADVWQAVRALVPPDRWPRSPYLTWAELARKLRCPPSVATYHVKLLGWAWRGRYEGRRVVRAPCLRCGTICDADELNPRTGLGSCCAGQRRRRA